MKKITQYLLIVAAIVLLVNILSDSFFVRLDLTQDNRYTLSKATKNLLRNLEEPVTVTAYFSKDVPAQMAKTKRDFKELLVEYHNLSKGMVVYEFLNPGASDEEEQKAMSAGIQPVIATIREKNEAKQQKVYLGAAVSIGDEIEIIPFMQPGAAMEYALSSAIKKISVTDKPVVGFIQGHGEHSLGAMPQALDALRVMYEVEPVFQSDTVNQLLRFETVVLLAPKDTISPIHLMQLDEFLGRGGNLLVGINRVEGELSTARGYSVETGLESWLMSKGVVVENNFIIDNNAVNINVRQQQGIFTFNTAVKFPYIPIIKTFADHPITGGLEAVVLQFASTVSYTGDTTRTFTPLLMSSEMSATLPSPVYFDVSKQWSQMDFPMNNLVAGGVLKGPLTGGVESQLIVFGDGDFPVNGEGEQARQQNPDNVSLLVNSIDFLSDDTGLIELRTKGVTNRPLDEIEESKKSFLKWFNFLLPLLLVLVYGIFRLQSNRNLRNKRMEEGYVW